MSGIDSQMGSFIFIYIFIYSWVDRFTDGGEWFFYIIVYSLIHELIYLFNS